ncbi:MAG: protein kinase domain-containing protein [Pirellulales bacterium]
MAELSAEEFAQRAIDYDLIDAQKMDQVWSEVGSREIALGEFQNALLRRELLTNYQVERLLKGLRTGYYYGDYKVLYLIGTGTFARVFRTVHRETGKVVAAKVLRRRFSDDPKRANQFMSEGELGKGLRHPNICPIFEVHSESSMHQKGTNYFLIIEFIEGQNLREMLKVRGRFDPADAVKLMIDIAAGMTYASDQGLTHRDLKTSNVLISSNGHAKLVDFGLAAFADQVQEDGAATNPRTVDYAGLELATNAPRDDHRSDIFFAGCILYEMLAGKPALYETRDRTKRLSADRYTKFEPVAHLAPDLPRSIAMVVNKAMELDPDRRYSSPGEMLLDLKASQQKIEAGEDARAGDIIMKLEAEKIEEREPKEREGLNKTIMVVEANEKMQNVLRERLKRYGYRVLIISDPDRARIRFEEDMQKPADIVVFSTVALGLGALDAFNQFADAPHTKDVPAILLLRAEQEELKEQAILTGKRDVMMMPIKVRQLRNMVRGLLGDPQVDDD